MYRTKNCQISLKIINKPSKYNKFLNALLPIRFIKVNTLQIAIFLNYMKDINDNYQDYTI